jgi:hypothetical protein
MICQLAPPVDNSFAPNCPCKNSQDQSHANQWNRICEKFMHSFRIIPPYKIEIKKIKPLDLEKFLLIV